MLPSRLFFYGKYCCLFLPLVSSLNKVFFLSEPFLLPHDMSLACNNVI